jgi:hypothetical protein
MDEKPQYEGIIQAGLDLPSEKKIYFNGFTVSVTSADIIIILQHNNIPVAFLNASHTIAKTLASQLMGVIETFQNDSGTEVLTLDDVQVRTQSIKNAKNRDNSK